MVSPLNIDPTRSITLRRSFSQGLSKTFAKLRREMMELLVLEDAFGLKSRPVINLAHDFASTQVDITDQKVIEVIKKIQKTITHDDLVKIEDEPHITIRYGLLDYPQTPQEVLTMVMDYGEIEVKVGKLSLFKTPKADVLKFDIESPQLRDLNSRIKLIPGYDSYEYSPHMTVAYIKIGRGEQYLTSFPEIEGRVMKFDTLTYSNKEGDKTQITFNQRWRYRNQTEAVEEFEKWLEGKVQQHLLSSTEANKWRAYIRRGFVKGASRAFDDTSRVRKTLARDEMRGADFAEGKREGFLRISLGKSTAAEKLKLLEANALSEVKGMTDDLKNKAKRVITDGLIRNQNPTDIARTLAKVLDISKGRSETIAFTELVRAHADGQLETMDQLGVAEVGVAVEWSTADNPCPLCQPLQGVVLKITEARGMLPRHPRCRCAWLPANIGEDKEERKTQKRGKYKIDKAIKASQKRGDDDWSPKPIARQRPKPIINVEVCECHKSFEELLGRLEDG